MPKILFLVNVDRFFLSHRLPIALHMKEKGYEVYVACDNTGYKDRILRSGLKYIETKIDGTNTNILKNLFTLIGVYRIYRSHNFDIIHNVTIKPVLYGSLVGRLLGKKKIVNAISGFGHLFTENRGQSTRGNLIKSFLKNAFSYKKLRFIVQNTDDLEMLTETFNVPSNRIILIKGSGVNLKNVQYAHPEEREKVKLLLHARMIYDKGVLEFYQMATRLKQDYGDRIECILCGSLDPNVTAVPETVLQQWNEEGNVNWIGYSEQIFEVIADSDIIVYPSYYREGLPKSLIDAAAVGRPIITYNVTGCRDALIEGENGFFAETKNIDDLVKYAKILIEDRDLRLQMGLASRRLAEQNFDINLVIRDTVELYDHFETANVKTPMVSRKLDLDKAY